jgi:hypothetical protein
MHDGFGALSDMRLQDTEKVLDGAELEALRSASAEGAKVSDGFGSFTTAALEALVKKERRAVRFSIVNWAKLYFANHPPKLPKLNYESFIGVHPQRVIEESASMIANPVVEKANPLANAALNVFQQHVVSMPPAPQVMVSGAAAMLSPVTGLPVGLMGIHI